MFNRRQRHSITPRASTQFQMVKARLLLERFKRIVPSALFVFFRTNRCPAVIVVLRCSARDLSYIGAGL